MAWGAEYQTPAEVDEQRAQQDAVLEAQQRAKLSQFERRVVDLLTDIAGSMKRIADSSEPVYEYDPQTGRARVLRRSESVERGRLALENAMLRAERGETSSSEGDVGTASAEPVADPGSARPDADSPNPS